MSQRHWPRHLFTHKKSQISLSRNVCVGGEKEREREILSGPYLLWVPGLVLSFSLVNSLLLPEEVHSGIERTQVIEKLRDQYCKSNPEAIEVRFLQ